MLRVEDKHGNLVGVILAHESVGATWKRIVKDLPPEYGPDLAYHMLDWARQSGYVVLCPKPAWMLHINGETN